MKSRFVGVGSKDLIIFLTGWGCDEIQFLNMIRSNSNYDLLICWDYSDLELKSDIDFTRYDKIYLLAYSAGVYIANFMQNILPKTIKSVAINGNPLMFNEYFGLKPDIIRTFRTLTLDNYVEFRRQYLVASEEELEFFNKHSSMRTFESCNSELDFLEDLSKKDYKPYNFDIALLSKDDRIFDFSKQKEYFKNYISLENMAHNIFYKYQTFDEIINLL